jgi:aminoglycoside phosphotransferase (APT) family kinase protein
LVILHRMQLVSRPGRWYTRAVQKHRRYLKAFQTCGVTFEYADAVASFIEANVGWMRGRPNTFQHQHDDFHPSNIVIKDGLYAGVIDFGRHDWGDPIHDFYKVPFFSRRISVPYSVGQISGYFDHKGVPHWFWRLYALYAAMGVFSSIVWTVRVMPEMLEDMVERVHTIIDDHKCFERLKPGWFALISGLVHRPTSGCRRTRCARR